MQLSDGELLRLRVLLPLSHRLLLLRGLLLRRLLLRVRLLLQGRYASF